MSEVEESRGDGWVSRGHAGPVPGGTSTLSWAGSPQQQQCQPRDNTECCLNPKPRCVPAVAGWCWSRSAASQNQTDPNKRGTAGRDGILPAGNPYTKPPWRHTWALSSLCNQRSPRSHRMASKKRCLLGTERLGLFGKFRVCFFPSCALKPPGSSPAHGATSPRGGRSGAGRDVAVTGSAAALPNEWAVRTPPAPARARRSSGSPRAAPGAGPARSAGSCPPGRTPSPAACRTCGC